MLQEDLLGEQMYPAALNNNHSSFSTKAVRHLLLYGMLSAHSMYRSCVCRDTLLLKKKSPLRLVNFTTHIKVQMKGMRYYRYGPVLVFHNWCEYEL